MDEFHLHFRFIWIEIWRVVRRHETHVRARSAQSSWITTESTFMIPIFRSFSYMLFFVISIIYLPILICPARNSCGRASDQSTVTCTNDNTTQSTVRVSRTLPLPNAMTPKTTNWKWNSIRTHTHTHEYTQTDTIFRAYEMKAVATFHGRILFIFKWKKITNKITQTRARAKMKMKNEISP